MIMNIKRICIVCMMLPGIVTISHAGSIYSQSGIGLFKFFSGTNNRGLGGVRIGTISATKLPYLNPANLSLITTTRFDGSFLFEQTDISIFNVEGKRADAILNSFQLTFPVKSSFSFAFGLQPYSTTAYDYTSLINNDGFEAVQSVSGAGSLQRGFLNLGGKINNIISVGVGTDFYFGRVKKTWRLTYLDSQFFPTADENQSFLSGIGVHLGMLARLHKKLYVGAVYYSAATINIENKAVFNFGKETDIVTKDEKLPEIFGMGASFIPNNNLQIAFDYMVQASKENEQDVLTGRQKHNARKIGFGIAVQPSTKLLSSPLKRLIYNFGFTASTMPYLDERGEVVDERFFTAGLSIPFANGKSMLDLSIEFGKRGRIPQNNAQESMIRVVAGVGTGELWFLRRKQ